VTTLELFFDLVFVFTMTQMSRALSEDLTLRGVLRVFLLFGILWYMYGGYAWLTNQAPPNTPSRQLLMLLAMAGFLTAALAIPEVFDQTGPVFGLGYLAVIVIHLLMFWQAASLKAVGRLAPFNLAAGGLVLAGGLVGGSPRTWLLVAALILQLVTPYLGVAPAFVVKAGHFVERHGLLMIVALGETVIAVGLGVDPTNLNALVMVTMLLTFAIPAALWWAYFADDASSAVTALERQEGGARSLLAIRGYFYAYIPMLLGIVLIAAGIHEALAEPSVPLPLVAESALAGGVALFLVGDIAFRRFLELGPNRVRSMAAVLCVASIPLGLVIPAWTHVLVQVILLITILVFERPTKERT
jgi:low temperature requirement protein LtrA